MGIMLDFKFNYSCWHFAGESIAKIWKVVREWKVYCEEYEVPPDQIEKIAPAFRHLDDLSRASLRKLIP